MVDQSKLFRLRALANEQRATQTSDSLIKREWTDLAIQWHLLANIAAEAAGKIPQIEITTETPQRE